MAKKPQGTRALTSTEKVRNLRERRAADGLSELRGVFVPTRLHQDAKRVLREWIAALKAKD